MKAGEVAELVVDSMSGRGVVRDTMFQVDQFVLVHSKYLCALCVIVKVR